MKIFQYAITIHGSIEYQGVLYIRNCELLVVLYNICVQVINEQTNSSVE